MFDRITKLGDRGSLGFVVCRERFFSPKSGKLEVLLNLRLEGRFGQGADDLLNL